MKPCSFPTLFPSRISPTSHLSHTSPTSHIVRSAQLHLPPSDACSRLLECKRREHDITIYVAKATESVLTAESACVNGRYNRCANRCYYACLQAAIAALLREGVRPRGQWSHAFVQAQFVGVLINQRQRYDPQLRRVRSDHQSVRDQADYRPELVTATQAGRALRRSRLFVTAIRQRGGGAQ